MKKRKEIAALLLVIGILSSLITVGASEVGTASNPLISLEWLQSTFLPQTKENLDDQVENKFSAIMGEILNTNAEGIELQLKRGDVITLISGSTLTPLDGIFSISSGGTVLDLTDGNELSSDTAVLTSNHRYLAAEDDMQALFTITTDTAVARLNGSYRLASSREIDYYALANALREMGLFYGSNTPYGSGYDLEQEPTRIQGLIIFLRLLGEEEAALNYTDTSVQFTDVSTWARPYVAYAYSKGYTGGQKIGENGEITFGQDTVMAPRDFLTFLLRAMNYREGIDFKWKTALTDAQNLGILTEGEITQLNEKPFLRAQVVYLSFVALSAQTADGSPLQECVLKSGKLSAAEMEQIITNISLDRL